MHQEQHHLLGLLTLPQGLFLSPSPGPGCGRAEREASLLPCSVRAGKRPSRSAHCREGGGRSARRARACRWSARRGGERWRTTSPGAHCHLKLAGPRTPHRPQRARRSARSEGHNHKAPPPASAHCDVTALLLLLVYRGGGEPQVSFLCVMRRDGLACSYSCMDNL